jgi:predicted RNA-binding Zn-ribbon protein involved in translation (DUF1610 family)
MGESTTFLCASCGYESRAIRWGVSVLDPRRRFMPAECMNCKDYVEVDLTGADLVVDEFHCDRCGNQVFFVERAESYGCPRCGGEKVDIRQGPTYW